jgi:hypothetical protein
MYCHSNFLFGRVLVDWFLSEVDLSVETFPESDEACCLASSASTSALCLSARCFGILDTNLTHRVIRSFLVSCRFSLPVFTSLTESSPELPSS